MTLMSSYNSSGLVGRCDARCYNAEHPDCHCICGGRNHGVGEKAAMDNTREYCEEMVEAYRIKMRGILGEMNIDVAKLPDLNAQLKLF